ncbi:DMT family transporter [Actinoallomurus purpureus]|uniref:DMT family transporter n=1 Tax=Actinoallomurus purpureus TaxID=478114 RepID=UPI0020933223|nr:DMT family transporter [Actinoallomurus purpureus]MCO6009775.1 DMT family transporter [Actinoallomurus purpureus]
MIAVLFAVLAAASNALASVLQRRAARAAPADDAFRLALIWDLVGRREWLGGILALIFGFLFQAAALTTGSLSLVQPILVTELPITMVLIAWLFRIRLGSESWLAVGALTVGLAVLLAAAAPSPGRRHPDRIEWAIATLVTAGVIAYLVSMAKVTPGVARAMLLGIASGLGFAFTAALMKEATEVLSAGVVAVLTSWSVWAMVAAGLGSLFLLQNALHSGTLVAVQPALNVSDPVASIAYGVGLFGEEIRLGGWSVLEVLGVGLILYGSARLAQSPPIRRHAEVNPSDPEGENRPDP